MRGPVVVAGVPFMLPAPDERGRTHIDLKPSWLSCGFVEGSWDPAYGDLARWLRECADSARQSGGKADGYGMDRPWARKKT